MATCCQGDIAQIHVAWIKLQKLTDLGYETFPYPPYSPDLSCTISGSQHLPTFFFNVKNISFQVESAFKDFMTSKPLECYHTGINNLIN